MKQNEKNKYDDIIMLPHHVSKKHPQMPLLNRAAQFSPFAALTGHDAAIQETQRLTDSFIEIGGSREIKLNEQLLLIRHNLDKRPELKITYFQPDERKSGGSYITVCGRIKKIDEYNRQIIFVDGTVLPIDHIFSIQGDLFSGMDGSEI
ncbi:hypothetical protein D3Z55_10435 [Clostridiaceae bacterium]|nr:YolD-like family protein [Lachnospiraceae bacterium]NBH17873.1 hypothetical protein [Clostridiaceae bacterium]